MFTIERPDTDARWAAYLNCRYRNLYEPFGLGLEINTSALDHPRDRPEIVHAMAMAGGKLAAVGRLDLQPDHPRGPSAQVRYCAVDQPFRGGGAGQALMRFFEQEAQRHACPRVWMEARTPAVNFYARLGYRDIGEGPLKYGCIPHRLMEKELPSPARGPSAAA